MQLSQNQLDPLQTLSEANIPGPVLAAVVGNILSKGRGAAGEAGGSGEGPLPRMHPGYDVIEG